MGGASRAGRGVGITARGPWGPGGPGSGSPQGALTWLHRPTDDPQDVGGVPQLQAVVDTHVHLAWGAKGATRVLALPTPSPHAGETEAQGGEKVNPMIKDLS